MSTFRISLAIAAILAMTSPLRLAQAQIVSNAESGKHPGLFIEPDAFQSDLQFFAPAQITDYGGKPEANTGFFFTYDRVYVNVSRPVSDLTQSPPRNAPPGDPFASDRYSFIQQNDSFWEGDFTWGNRLEMGFTSEDDCGWSLVGWHIDGPNNESQITNGDRLLLNAQEIGPNAPLIADPLDINATVNTMKLGGFEINRIMKRHYFHHGGVFEPLVGVRYIKLDDRFKYSYYRRSETDQAFIDDLEVYHVENNWSENNMLGGQLGFRMFKETGHWKLSSELRMFGMQNWQHYSSQNDEYVWAGPAGPKVNPPRVPDYSYQQRFVSYDKDNQVVWGGELKMEAAYQLTKYISFRTGFLFLDLGRGVARGRTMQYNDQDVQMFGMTFGFDINR